MTKQKLNRISGNILNSLTFGLYFTLSLSLSIVYPLNILQCTMCTYVQQKSAWEFECNITFYVSSLIKYITCNFALNSNDSWLKHTNFRTNKFDHVKRSKSGTAHLNRTLYAKL